MTTHTDLYLAEGATVKARWCIDAPSLTISLDGSWRDDATLYLGTGVGVDHKATALAQLDALQRALDDARLLIAGRPDPTPGPDDPDDEPTDEPVRMGITAASALMEATGPAGDAARGRAAVNLAAGLVALGMDATEAAAYAFPDQPADLIPYPTAELMDAQAGVASESELRAMWGDR